MWGLDSKYIYIFCKAEKQHYFTQNKLSVFACLYCGDHNLYTNSSWKIAWTGATLIRVKFPHTSCAAVIHARCMFKCVCVSLHKHWHIFAEEMFAKGFRAILGCETVTLRRATYIWDYLHMARQVSHERGTRKRRPLTLIHKSKKIRGGGKTVHVVFKGTVAWDGFQA